eukprot:gb/GEZN01013671.1/.p1 GENE.gb/GEZN01013671.1/~~gb/GEZN01013671.1/.p1  ORF type:complete len:326 (-),score=77.96 gb/GEZN01013671.1/:6-983(-)
MTSTRPLSLSTLLLLLLLPCALTDDPPTEGTEPSEVPSGVEPDAAIAESPEEQDEQNLHVLCETSVGDLTITMHREWAPIGHDHFLRLVRLGFFTDSLVYAVHPGFVAQFGFHPHPAVQAMWGRRRLKDDPKHDPPINFTQGTLCFSGSGQPNSRSTPMFFSLEPNGPEGLGELPHETPIGRVEDAEQQKLLNTFHNKYSSKGKEIYKRIYKEGNKKLIKEFPNLSKFKRCYIVEENPDGPPPYEPPALLEEEEEEEGGGAKPGKRRRPVYKAAKQEVEVEEEQQEVEGEEQQQEGGGEAEGGRAGTKEDEEERVGAEEKAKEEL